MFVSTITAVVRSTYTKKDVSRNLHKPSNPVQKKSKTHPLLVRGEYVLKRDLFFLCNKKVMVQQNYKNIKFRYVSPACLLLVAYSSEIMYLFSLNLILRVVKPPCPEQ